MVQDGRADQINLQFTLSVLFLVGGVH